MIRIVFYSLDGNTQKTAEYIREKTDAQTVRLEPSQEIPKRGLAKFLHGGRSAIEGSKVELRPYDFHADAGDRVILACPVWAGRMPPAMAEFVHVHSLKGCDVYLVGCSMSGNAQGMFSRMREKLEGSVLDSLSLREPGKHIQEMESAVDAFLARNSLKP